jgi:hypothetical protein
MYYVEFLSTARCAAFATGALIVALAVNLFIWNAAHLHADPIDRFSVDIVWAFGGIVSSIVASILARSLASENDGHLPVAWTKPFSRVAHALAKFAVDLAAAVYVFALTCGVVFVYLAATGLFHNVMPSSDSWSQLLRFFLAPFAFYGLAQALTSTLSRQAGLVVGLTWVACVILIILSLVNLPAVFHAIVDFINYANPLVYLAFAVDDKGTVITYGSSAAALALALLALIGSVTAIYRWQRLEA